MTMSCTTPPTLTSHHSCKTYGISTSLTIDKHFTHNRQLFLQLVWAYAFLSGLAGMAVTYYYDDEHNIKLLNILKYGLMLLGLGLVYCSTSMAEASVMLCVLLLASVPASLLWDTR